MAYQKTIWEAREGEGLERFAKSEETADSVVLINSPESITNPGTELSPENMNHIEGGIEAAHNLVADEANARVAADQGLQEQIDILTPEGQENLPDRLTGIEARLDSLQGVNQHTFAVDSDAALAACATDAPGNDYTHVLIKAGTWAYVDPRTNPRFTVLLFRCFSMFPIYQIPQ